MSHLGFSKGAHRLSLALVKILNYNLLYIVFAEKVELWFYFKVSIAVHDLLPGTNSRLRHRLRHIFVTRFLFSFQIIVCTFLDLLCNFLFSSWLRGSSIKNSVHAMSRVKNQLLILYRVDLHPTPIFSSRINSWYQLLCSFCHLKFWRW